jgi:hypothetical protein
VSLSAGNAFLARSSRPWSHIKRNWGRTGAAPALLFFNQRRKLSSPSLFFSFSCVGLLFSFPLSCAGLLHGVAWWGRNPTAAWPDDGCGSSRHHGSTTPQMAQAPPCSAGAGEGSTNIAAAWSYDSGFRSGPDGSRYGLRSFFIFKNRFLVPADISSWHQSLNFLCQSTPTDIKDAWFFVSHKKYHIFWQTLKADYQPPLQNFFIGVSGNNGWLKGGKGGTSSSKAGSNDAGDNGSKPQTDRIKSKCHSYVKTGHRA